MAILEIQGHLNAQPYAFAIIASRQNELVCQQLLQGAIYTLKRHNAKENQITVVWVPNALEIPLIAQQLATSGNYQGIICLGCMIRCPTICCDAVSNQLAQRIGKIAQQHAISVSFGLIAADDLEQALQHAGGKGGNRGSEAALAAIEIADLIHHLRS